MSVFLTLVAAAALQGAQDPDPRWLAFAGCWQAEVEEAAASPAPMLCFRPEAEGVAITTWTDGKSLGERQLRIGSGPLEEGGCRGTESTRWSQDGRRLLTRSELECAGGLERSSRGILALVSRGTLVDIQSVTVAGEDAVRMVRYTAAPAGAHPAGQQPDPARELARETARANAALPLPLEAMVETHREVDAAALETLLGARRAGYSLDAGTLVQLADAGLPPSTIDVLVALSYPEHFEVREQRPPRERMALGDPTPWGGGRWGPTRTRYGCYGYGYGYDPYYYSPYGCDPYGWGYGSGWVYVVPRGSVIRDDDDGRGGSAVKGRGYRQGESPATGTARPRARPADSAPATGRTRGATTGTGGGTRAAPSSTGRSGDTGRKAKPRGDG